MIAVGTGGQSAVAHPLDQDTIGLLGALQQNDLGTFEAPHHDDGVDVALMNGLNRLVGIVEQRRFGSRSGSGIVTLRVRSLPDSVECRGR